MFIGANHWIDALNDFDDVPPSPAKSSDDRQSVASSSSEKQVNPSDIDLDEVFDKTLTSEEKNVVRHLTDQVTKFFSDLEQTEEKSTETASSSSTNPQSSQNFQDIMKNTLDMLNKNAASMDNPNIVGEANQDTEQEEPVDEGSFSNLLQSMMEVLMSPDILRQPMEELREKYPLWLKEKKGQVSDEEYQRVQRQYDLCCKICQVYETQKYPDAIDELVELMKAMQEQGQPPEEIVSQLSKPEGAGSEEESNVQKLLQGLNLSGLGGSGSNNDGKGCPTQ